MDQNLQVSVSPHVRDNITTARIMQYVFISLLPACAVGVMNFGIPALIVLIVSVASAVAAEYIYEKLLKKPITTNDFSAAVTGLLIGMNMPPKISWWIPVLGSFFAIIVIKQLYGGIGKNFMNPALGARCFLLISFSRQMTAYGATQGFLPLYTGGLDAQSGATPLAVLKTGTNMNLSSLFLGNTLGVIGETSTLALLIGAAFLVYMKVIELRIPLTYLGTFAVLTLITSAVKGLGSGPLYFTASELCAGGIMLGAFFMATDYSTSPITESGQYIFGALLGILTWLFRLFGNGSEGVSYAIIFGNCLVPLIEHYTRPMAFGIRKERKEAPKA
jgi:electron transport complex protein RnfD